MKKLLLLSLTTLLSSGFLDSSLGLTAQGVTPHIDQQNPPLDIEALEKWLQEKRMVSMKSFGGDLSISGEVRTEIKYTREKQKAQGFPYYIQQRGINSATGKPELAWDAEFNLMLDYRADRTWGAMKVEFDNVMGTLESSDDHIRLEKAYMGARVVDGDSFTFDTEIGRRYLSNVFDSKLQFGSVFDGILFRFSKAYPTVGDLYASLGGFLVNAKSNHYGEALEIGALKVGATPLSLRYSLVNWNRHYTQSQLNNNSGSSDFYQPWNYLVNQWTMLYQYNPTFLNKKLLKLYGAFLWNASAKKTELTHFKKSNLGWYAGFSAGTIKKPYDWAIDFNYQWAEAQVAPTLDCSGIGRGNAANKGFFTAKRDGSGLVSTSTNAFSPYNYHGFEFDFLYALSGNLTVQNHFAYSWTLDKSTGPNNVFKQYEIEFIYAF
jgi:hypothetical protein